MHRARKPGRLISQGPVGPFFMLYCPAAMSLLRPLLTAPLFILGMAALGGCEKAEVPAPASVSSSLVSQDAASSPASAPSAPSQPEVIKGVFFWGPEVETISPCNTNQSYWLEGNEILLAPLEELALAKANQANEAYQPIYAELRVVRKGQATDGFAVEYDGVVELQEVLRSSNTIPPDCKLIETPDPGQEPAAEPVAETASAAASGTASAPKVAASAASHPNRKMRRRPASAPAK